MEKNIPIRVKSLVYQFTWDEWSRILTPAAYKIARKVSRQGGELIVNEGGISERFKEYFK